MDDAVPSSGDEDADASQVALLQAQAYCRTDDPRAVDAARQAYQQVKACAPAFYFQATETLVTALIADGAFDEALSLLHGAFADPLFSAAAAAQSTLRTLHASALQQIAQLDEALDEALLARSLARQAGDTRAECRALLVSTWIYRALGQPEQGLKIAAESLEIAQRDGHKLEAARARMNLANAHVERAAAQKFAAGSAQAMEVLALALPMIRLAATDLEALEELRLAALARRNIAICQLEFGDPSEAVAALRLEAQCAQATGSSNALEHALRALGDALLRLSRHEEALEVLHQALAMPQQARRLEFRSHTHQGIAKANAALQRFQQAYEHMCNHVELQLKIVSERGHCRARAVAVQLDTEKALAQAAVSERRAFDLARRNDVLQTETEKLRVDSEHDALTGLPNRRRLGTFVKQLMDAQDSILYSAAVLDIDHFKLVNDRFSHEVGDTVLSTLADILRGACRTTDLAARLGGEEFVIVFAHVGSDEAFVACERLREAIERFDWSTVHPDLKVTVSIGLADSRDHSDWSVMLDIADKRLYQAKRNGRNRVISQ